MFVFNMVEEGLSIPIRPRKMSGSLIPLHNYTLLVLNAAIKYCPTQEMARVINVARKNVERIKRRVSF